METLAEKRTEAMKDISYVKEEMYKVEMSDEDRRGVNNFLDFGIKLSDAGFAAMDNGLLEKKVEVDPTLNGIKRMRGVAQAILDNLEALELSVSDTAVICTAMQGLLSISEDRILDAINGAMSRLD
jgi:hypothetical protein